MSEGFACHQCGRANTFRFTAEMPPVCSYCGAPLHAPLSTSPVPLVQASRPLPRCGGYRPGPFSRQITRHITRTIGPATMVFHDALPNDTLLDIHVIPPRAGGTSPAHPFGKNFYTLVTSGLSTQKLIAGKKCATDMPMELMISLPADWAGLKPDGTLDALAMEQEAHAWPLLWLKAIARANIESPGEKIAAGSALPRGDAKTLAPAIAFTHLLVGPPRLHPRSHAMLVHDDIQISFHALWPLHPAEADFNLKHGPDAMLAEFERENISDLVNLNRPATLHHATQRA